MKKFVLWFLKCLPLIIGIILITLSQTILNKNFGVLVFGIIFLICGFFTLFTLIPLGGNKRIKRRGKGITKGNPYWKPKKQR